MNHRIGTIVLAGIGSLCGQASGQEMTFTAVTDPPDAVIRAGETIHVDIVAQWAPPELGLAGVFFDLIVSPDFENGTLNTDEATGLGRNVSLRVAGGEGGLADADDDGDLDITGIEAFQQGPVFNAGFNDSNPIVVYSFEWTAPVLQVETYQVSVSMDVDPRFPTVWEDSFFTIQYTPSEWSVEWDVEPPPGPLDFDVNEVTDVLDLGILLASFGSSSGDFRFNPRPDLDQSGDIGFPDLFYLKSFLRNDCPNTPTDGLPVATDIALVGIDNTGVTPGDDALAPSFDGGVTHFTFDLRVTLAGSVDWSACSASATLDMPGVTFFQHARESSGGFSPLANELPLMPALEFDTFFTGASQAAPSSPGTFPAFAADRSIEPAEICATWFDAKRTIGGEFSIARFTIVSDGATSGSVGSIRGVVITNDVTSEARSFDLPFVLP